MFSVSASFESKRKRRDKEDMRLGGRYKLRTTYPADETMGAPIAMLVIASPNQQLVMVFSTPKEN